MVSKRLATAVLVTGALHSGIASALGVGELSLESALNQPFRAEIPLRDVGELDVEQIRIALADASAFENAGVERSQFLSALQFHVELQRGGRGRIIVTTEKAVQEPYLDFIVEVRWPNGKMNREYTVLLDLPVFAPTSSASSVSVGSASKVTKPTPLAEPSQREQGGSIGIASREAPQVRDVAQQQMLPKSKDATEYRVQHHDTMWKISQKLRPSAYVTTQQTMLALLKKNPKAFVGGNVNRIKSGYVLRIPSEAEVQEINQSQAVNEIRAQAREWRGEKVKRSAPDKKAPAETKTTMASASAPQLDATDKSGRSPVAAQDQAVKFSVGSAGSDASASNDVEALRQKVREEQENLDKTLLENESMQTRVVEMEKQIRTLQSLITLKNSQLAALQGGVAGVDAVPVPNQSADMNVQSDDASIATSPESEAPSSEANSAMVADTNLAADKGAAEIANSSVEAAAEPIAENKPESAAVTPDTMAATAQEWFTNGLVKYIGLGLAVLALLVLIIRRKTAHSDEEADLAAFEASLAAGAATEGDVFAAEPEALDFDIGNTDATELNDEQEPTFSANDFDFDDIDVESADVDGAGIETKVEVAEELESDIDLFAAESDDSEAVQPQTGDIVAEADIYVAYGRYDQAASLLKTAISQDPDNADLQVKLADIYVDTRDRESFIEAYTGLQSLGDVAAIARVKESMSAIDGVSDWLDAEDDKPAVNTVDLELDGDFDLGDDLDFELDDDSPFAEGVNADIADSASNSLNDNALESLDATILTGEPSESTGSGAEEESEGQGLSSLELGADFGESESDAEVDDVQSLRSAEADTLASLDVDLADLDFDFDDDSLPMIEAGSDDEPSAEAGSLPESDLALDEAPLSIVTSDSVTPLDVSADAGDELDFEFGDLQDSELDTGLSGAAADPAELSNLATIGDDSDEELDLDFSSFDSSSPEFRENNAEIDTGVSAVEADNVDVSNDRPSVGDQAFLAERAGDVPDGEQDDGNAEVVSADEGLRSTAPLSNDLAGELSLDDLDFDLGDELDPAEHDTAEIDQSELDVDLSDFDMPAIPVTSTPFTELSSSVGEARATEASALDDAFFVEGDDIESTPPLNPLSDGEAIAVEDLVFDEFDAGEGDENFDNLLDDESVATKLDLARAYVDMGDSEGAKEMLEEVLIEGDIQQQSDAQALLDLIG